MQNQRNLKGRYHGALVFALAGLLAGCAEYKDQPISPAQTAIALEGRRLDDPRLIQFIQEASPGAAQVWNLHSLTLASLYFHPEMELSRAKVALAEAAVLTAKQRPNPILSFLPSYNTTITTPSPWTIGSIISLLVDVSGQRQARIAQSESLVEAARQDLVTASWQLRGQVRSALLLLWASKGRLDLIDRRIAIQEQFVSILERRFLVGEATALDVSRERIALNQMNLTAAEVGRQIEEARTKLASAVGIPYQALDDVAPSLAEFERPAVQNPIESASKSELRRKALETRSDVLGLLSEYNAAQAALRLEIARQYSAVTLGPGYTYDQGENVYSFEIGGELPIFNQNQGPIAEMVAKRKEAAARFIALQAQIIGGIDLAVANHRAAIRAFDLANDQLDRQAERRRQLQRGVQLGELDSSTLASADVELGTAQLARYDAYIQQYLALELLEDALHQPLFTNEDLVSLGAKAGQVN